MLADDNLVSILLQSFTLVKTSKFSSDNSLAGSREVGALKSEVQHLTSGKVLRWKKQGSTFSCGL